MFISQQYDVWDNLSWDFAATYLTSPCVCSCIFTYMNL
jgi:hypothetical protein